MSEHSGFVYMDEASIDDEFKCLICNELFEKPMCTPCDHTFCQFCIEQSINKSAGENGSCPVCRRALSIEQDLKPASRLISNRIDRYLVQCLVCRADQIPCGSFVDYLTKICKNMNVSCAASDIACPWTGTRNLLENHVKSCPYQQLRPILGALQSKNSSLEQMLIEQQKQLNDIQEQGRAQQRQIDHLQSTWRSFRISAPSRELMRSHVAPIYSSS